MEEKRPVPLLSKVLVVGLRALIWMPLGGVVGYMVVRPFDRNRIHIGFLAGALLAGLISVIFWDRLARFLFERFGWPTTRR
jgi:uncharacterized membrane protein YjjB (DUF3815 family)